MEKRPHRNRNLTEAGADPGICRAGRAMLTSQQRWLQVNESTCSKPLRATGGLPQGDPLSVLGLRAYALMWFMAVRTAHPELRVLIYADDWSVAVPCTCAMQEVKFYPRALPRPTPPLS